MRHKATKLLAHPFIKTGIAGKENPAVSPEQMQMTLRQHNQSKKAVVSGIDWGMQEDVLHKQAKELKMGDERQGCA